jgi:hypothetical protein
VRSGCFNIPPSTSPDQSFSESTITNNSDMTLTQTSVHEYKPSLNEQISSTLTSDQDTWIVVDLEPIKPQYSSTPPDESKVRTLSYLFIQKKRRAGDSLRPSFLKIFLSFKKKNYRQTFTYICQYLSP